MQALCLDIACADQAALRGKVEYALRICSLLHVAKCIHLLPSVNSSPLHAYAVVLFCTSILLATTAKIRAVRYFLSSSIAFSIFSIRASIFCCLAIEKGGDDLLARQRKERELCWIDVLAANLGNGWSVYRTVEPAQNGEREDDILVLAALKDIAD